MNKADQHLIDLALELQAEGKDVKITVLPSTIKQKRKMQLRRHSTTA